MIEISYSFVLARISFLWIFIRFIYYLRTKKLDLKRELQLLLVYICIVVVVRFTFFPFSKINGKIQPLIFDFVKMFDFRINLIPFVNLLEYEIKREMLINVIGNTTMFMPLGIVWPIVYKELNTHKKVIAAGVGFSLLIEILQLLFYDRVTDIDDLILNSLGFIAGYLIYLLVKNLKRKSN